MKQENKSLYSHKVSNISKTWSLLIIMGGMILGVGYIMSVYLESPFIMIIAGFGSIFTSVGTYWFSDSIALKTSGAKIIERSNNRKLYDIVDNVAIAAGLPTPKIGIIEDSAFNAFATGRNPSKGVVVFTTGLLKALNKEEIIGVAAHEMSHIANRDVLIGTIAVVFASIISMSARIIHFGGSGNNRRGGVITLIIGIVLMFVAPFVATILQMSISRKREFLADATGAYLTGNPEGLASALEKISKSGKPLDRATEATAHLFISNPFGSKKIRKMFSTHPPIEERIARLRGIDKYGDI